MHEQGVGAREEEEGGVGRLDGSWRKSGRREDEELQALRGNGWQDWLPGWYVNEAADSQN